MIKNKIFLQPFFVVLFLFLFPAIPALSMVIVPSKAFVTTKYGVTSRKNFTLWNDGKKSTNYKVYCWEFIFKKGSKKLAFKPPALGNKKSLANFVTIVPDKFTLGAGEKKTVEVVIDTPQTVSGGNQLVVFFESDPETSPKRNKKNKVLKFRTRMGALLFQETEGTTMAKSRINAVTILDQTSTKPISINIEALNQGNVNIFASAVVSIMDNNYKYIGKIEIPDKIIPIGEKNTLKSNFNIHLTSGTYHALVTYLYKDKNIVIDKVFTVN